MKARGAVLVFGGTTEGRMLCEALSLSDRETVVCTATGYGAATMGSLPHVRVCEGRLDAEAMAEFIFGYASSGKAAFEVVIDATHPYAGEVTRNIRAASARAGLPYVRVVREEEALPSDVRLVANMEAAMAYLAGTSGNILLATGSKDLSFVRRLPDYCDRIYARILPDVDSISACNALGLRGKHIIAMQGPFSRELNLALLRQFGCAFLLTKSSGSAGGLEEKISAARDAGAELVLIRRPEQESGHSLDEVLNMLELPPRVPVPTASAPEGLRAQSFRSGPDSPPGGEA